MSLRQSAPNRSDRATVYRSLPQIAAGQFKGWLSPHLEMGAGNNQNKFGNLHAQTGSNTSAAGTAPMAFSALGDTFAGRRVVINGTVSGTSLTVNSITSGNSGDIAAGMAVLYGAWQTNGAAGTGYIASGTYPNFTLSSSSGNATSVAITIVDRYLGLDGQPSFSRIADPAGVAGRYCWQHRLTFEDYRPSGQDDTSVGLQKVLARFGDTGAEVSNGLGILQPVGSYYMDLFAIRVPAATHLQTRCVDDILLWQHKNSSGQPGFSIAMTAGKARSGNANIISNGKQIALAADALSPRLTCITYGDDGSSGSPAGKDFTSQDIVLADYPSDTWIYLLVRVKPQLYQADNPRTQVWVAAGSGSVVKAVDHAFANCDVAATDVNRQWGWYVGSSSTYMDQTTGANDFNNQRPWWGAGNEINLQVKDYLVFPQWAADMEPPLWLVDQWFDVLRSR